MNYGYISEWFFPSCIHQGVPESPYIFLLVIEPLGMLIRKNKEIRGIKIPYGEEEQELKSCQFADDMVLSLMGESIGGSGGVCRAHVPPPMGPNSFIFAYIFT